MTDMIEVKVSDLAGPALDWAVAQVESVPVAIASPHYGTGWRVYRLDFGEKYSPSTDWSLGGQLIEPNQVFLEPPHDVHRANYDEKTGRVKGCWETYESWHATVSATVRTLPPKAEGFPGRVGRGEGETALIAACRAIVKSYFDDVVNVPRELVS